MTTRKFNYQYTCKYTPNTYIRSAGGLIHKSYCEFRSCMFEIQCHIAYKKIATYVLINKIDAKMKQESTRESLKSANLRMFTSMDDSQYYTYSKVQTSHNLNGTSKQNTKNVCHTHASAKIKFCVCLRVLFESVAEWIYSCWIIVSRRFIVLNRTL